MTTPYGRIFTTEMKKKEKIPVAALYSRTSPRQIFSSDHDSSPLDTETYWSICYASGIWDKQRRGI
jgi:hypothetical protein